MKLTTILSAGALVTAGAVGALGVSALVRSAPAATEAGATITPVAFTQARERAAGEIDSVHSGVVFRIMHMGASPFHGMFPGVTGTMVADPANPDATSIDVTIDVGKVWTGHNGRDEHLRSADYFNARQFPTSTFKATGGKSAGDGTITVDGELTLLGKALPVSATITRTGEGEMRGNRIVGYEATMSFDRSDFGMTSGIDNGGLGDTVTLTIFIEAAAS